MIRRACSSTATVIVAGSLLLAATIAAQTGPGQDATAAVSRFPPGAGRDGLFRMCQDRHGPESVLAHLKTRDEWSTLDIPVDAAEAIVHARSTTGGLTRPDDLKRVSGIDPAKIDARIERLVF